ncbi:Calcium-binding and coiled-coil domain-containing protein 2 [Orchesella cincta]|uniref:Calcium-binding and coiled-coil domain-containing protein 2 n=1 Tax=Orchesella cincta TaxID=48709 RepID=A0A1D2MQ20_ORCCI|nr:Calcium-binding and coiled-coil domain-containing protein 2 [Orchesella cincta]
MALRSFFVVGIIFAAFTWNTASGSSSKLTVPRFSVASKAEYATHRPYKVDFDLLRASERSHELAMPLLTNNDIGRDREDSDDFILLTSDPTLRSRRSVRTRRQVQVQNSDFQRFSLCLPYFSTNPMCRQVFLGLNNGGGGGVVPSSTVALQSASSPSASPIYFPTSSASLSPQQPPPQLTRNDLALNYYYQQLQQPQAPPATPLQIGVFQGPLPVQRQRPINQQGDRQQTKQYQNIHVKYPYPYPPTLEQNPSLPQAVVPESGANGAPASPDLGVTTDSVPSDLVGETTQSPQDQNEEVQDPSGFIPDSPSAASPPNPPQSNLESSQSTTNAPQDHPTIASAPSSTEAPPAIAPPSSPGDLPASPPQTAAEQAALHQAELQNALDLTNSLQQRLKELEDSNSVLNSQLDQANQQVVSYEMESSSYKEQYQRSEDANMKLRDRVLQLENTNQHLQEQNGQLQQGNAEQRTQINALKVKAKEMKQQLDEAQQQFSPLSDEVQKHRKEIEGFLIRIRKLGEENETCKKQVRLYQLKINYIQDQQAQRDPIEEEQETVVVAAAPGSDGEMARMDAEIKALQKNADDVASQLEDLQKATTPSFPDVPEVTTLFPDNLDAKNENEFPGEAVQVPQRAPQQPPQEKTVATAADVARAEASRDSGSAAWEKPSGF